MCHIPLAQGKGLRSLVENCYTESDMMNHFKGGFLCILIQFISIFNLISFFYRKISEISKTEDSVTNLKNSKVKKLKRLNIFRHDLQTTPFLIPNKSKTKNQSIESNLRPISKIKIQHNEPKQNKKQDSANIENVKPNQPYVVKRHVERYKRSGSSFSLDMRRHPAIIADDLNSVDDWWKAFTELTT